MTRSLSVAAAVVLAAGLAAPVSAQSTNEIVNELLRTAPGAASPAPAAPVAPAAPAAPSADESQPAMYRHFDTTPSVRDIVDALLPAPAVRDLAEIPRQQRRAAGLMINFPYNSDQITSESAARLNQIGAALNDPQLSSYRIALHGHTDATGSDDYNMDLSRRRALAVQQYLSQSFSIPPARLQVGWHGERSPRFTPASNGSNRRVEFEVAGR